MTKHPKLYPRGAGAPARLAAIAITPFLFGSCLKRADRETIYIPPAPVGVAPAVPAGGATTPGTATGADAAVSEPAPPPYSLENAQKYVVQSGDALSTIAAKYGVSVSAVKAANQIADANKIRAGQTLLLPAAKDEAGDASSTTPAADAAGAADDDAGTALPGAEATPAPGGGDAEALGGIRIPGVPAGE